MDQPDWAPPPARSPWKIVVAGILAGLLMLPAVAGRLYRLLPGDGAIASFAPADSAGTGREGLPPVLTRIDDSIFRPLRVPETDPFGYPANPVDRPRLAAILLRRDYAALERMLDRTYLQVLQDVRYEYHLVDAFHALGLPGAEIGVRMDEWVARHPRSAHARLARARHHAARAWEARGGAWISETPPERIAAMQAAAAQAVEDLRAGQQLDPAHLVGFTTRLELLRMGGTVPRARAVLNEGLRAYPASYLLRDAYMAGLEPRWGGSLREMRRFGRESARLRARNPRLAALEGAVHAYVGEQHRRGKRFAAALREYDRAIAFGPEADFLRGRGRTWLLAEDFVRAHADLEAALQQRPQGPEGLELHGRALTGIARGLPPAIQGTALRRAEADFRLLAAVEPGSTAAERWLRHIDELKAWCSRLPDPCR